MTRITGSVPERRITSRPAPAEPGLAAGDRRLDRAAVEREGLAVAHAARTLRHRGEQAADFARRPSGLDDRGQNLQRRDQAVAGRRIIGEDDVARLLAAEIAAESAHLFDDIAVADRGAVQLDVLAVEKALEAEIGHHRRHQRAAGKPPAAGQPGGDQRHQLVAVEDDAALVGDDQPVGVAVERDADIGAARQHLAPHLLGHQRAAFAVDVEAVGRRRRAVKTSAPSSQNTVGATL